MVRCYRLFLKFEPTFSTVTHCENQESYRDQKGVSVFLLSSLFPFYGSFSLNVLVKLTYFCITAVYLKSRLHRENLRHLFAEYILF